MANRKRVVLVDGSGFIYRAYFAIPPHFTTVKGLHTNAVYGFATMFGKIFQGRRPDYGAVVFDAPGKTFRDELYPDYKGERQPMADELREQLPYIDKVVEVNRFPMLRVPGYEADDVIGTLSRMAVEAGMDVIIVSADKDFAQLVSDQVKMFDPAPGPRTGRRQAIAVTYDAELVKKKWGVKPELIVDLFALIGDKSDNIPGVPGIGQKGGTQLLAKYGSLDGVLGATSELKGRQKATLEENRDLAILSRDLATIDRFVPLDRGVEDLLIGEVDTAATNELYRELEFNSLLTADAQGGDAGEAEAGDYRTLVTIDDARSAIAGLPADRSIAVYPIYDLPTPVTGALVGVAFSSDPETAFYLPLATGAPSPDDDVVGLLRDWFDTAEREVVTYNAKFLRIALTRLDIALECRLDDLLLASYQVEPTKLIPHRLDQIVKEYLQRTVPPAKSILGSGKKVKRFSDVEPPEIGPYACLRADLVGRIRPILRQRLAGTGPERFLDEVALPLSRVLADMEITGIKVDPEDLARLGVEFHQRLDGFQAKIYQFAGREFNIGSTRQLSKVLFEELELPVVKRTKSGYSTDAEVLEKLAPKHGIAQHLLDHRKLAKLINTYTDVLQRSANPASGRIHATFQQTVAATGRLITTDPDLQRTPVKTREGRRIRQAFVPREGCVLMSADWSQIELRLLAHFTGDERLVEAFRDNLDVHRRTAGELFGCSPEDVTKDQRGVGKLVNFATIYGQGATALAAIIGVPRKEAQGYIEGYFEAYSGVREWLDRTIAEAHEHGYVETLLGRRRYIPELQSKSFMDKQAGERIAANTPIQGSAADICKLAMLAIAAELESRGLETKMLLQVHDELVFELPPAEVEELTALVRDKMEHVHPLDVPLVVDIGVGDSWAAAH